MKILPSRLRRHRFCRGLSLMEVTLAMVLTIIIATVAVGMIAQQVAFMSLMRAFSFLRDEAPVVNSHVVKLFSRAETYRIFASKEAGIAGVGAVNSQGKAAWMRFNNPDGTSEEAVVAFEGTGQNAALNYYYKDPVSGWGTSPNWTITSSVSNVTFSDSSGVLLITLTGPAGEELTYVATGE
ncbi:MAG: hypothetical protein R3F31_25500 [Verrucomicrobiales bacterium]|nr:hypothetical protein [Verrucomicrobiae bacterium]MCP5553601.1 hypothetical protein [Akkermansiaceae bacterium]HRX53178.1 hypothetical protein [Verrucomicrobiales bacterium]